MSQESRIEVINREGWRKEYPLQKGIVYIGSAPTNDIVLSGIHGVGVAPLHAQLIAAGGGDAGYKLVNLSDQEILLGSSGSETLPPRAVMSLPEGTTLRLGEFTLIFRGGAGVNYGGFNNGSGSANIGLRLSLPYTRLAPNQTLVGTATIRNLGGKTGARFDVVLEGLDEDCFDIEPGPLLSSGAEKDISFRLYHHGPRPLAGEWTFVIRATSSNAYPGEQAQVFQTIEVLPLYQHRLRLWPVKGIKVTSPPHQEKTSPLQNSLKAREERSRPRPQPEPEAVQEEWWATSEAGDESAPAQRPEVRRLKAQAPAPPPVAVTPVEPESEAQPAKTTLASSTAETGEEWGWAVKEEPQPAPPVRVSPSPEPSSPTPRQLEPEPAQPTYKQEETEPSLVLPPTPEPEAQTVRPVETEVAPPIQPAEIKPASPERQPAPPPEPAPPVEESSRFGKWWSRLKDALPFRSRTTEIARPAEPVAVDRPSPEIRAEPPPPFPQAQDAALQQAQDAAPGQTQEESQDVPFRQASPLGDFAGEPQNEAVIPEPPQWDTGEPERQVEVTHSQPAAEVEEQPEWESQAEVVALPQAEAGAVAPVGQGPELPVEEPAPEPEAPPPPAESKPSPQTTEFEDWWADDVEPETPAEDSSTLQPETPSLSEGQPAEAVESSSKTDDWWEAIEIRTRGKTEENPVIKLKANPAQVKQPETRSKTNEAEEWWAVDVEEASPEQSDKKQ